MSSTNAAAAVDVAVVGGGLAGVAAAVTAAALGARTRLVEAAPELGGNASLAFVHTLCGVFRPVAEGVDPVACNQGFASSFAEELHAAGAALPPERAGKTWVIPTEPRAIARLAAGRCARESNLEVWLEAPLAKVALARDGCGPHHLTVAGRHARSFDAEIALDTSGAAVLGRLGGATIAEPDPNLSQLPSFIACLRGVPAVDRVGFGRLRFAVSLAAAARRRASLEDCEAVLLRPAPGSDDAFLTLNLTRERTRRLSPDALAADAREKVANIVSYLRAERPGYAGCEVVAWPRAAGFREGARLIGCHEISEAEILKAHVGEDAVAHSAWPIELWLDPRKPTLRYPVGVAGIPLGALVSRSHPRVGMAGRCLSASPAALGALRVLGTAMATGEAIGAAAAIAAKRNVALSEVTPASIRAALRVGMPVDPA